MKIKLLCLLLLSNLSLFAQSINVPENGLIAYYPFTGNANDASGKGNNGAATDVTLTPDRFGNENSAYSFNGISSYIESTIADYPLKGESRTITGWFKVATPINSTEFDLCLLNYGNIDDPDYWFKISFYNKGYLDIQFDSNTVQSQDNYFNNNWTFFALTFDDTNNTYSLYINGVYKMGGAASLYTKGFNNFFRIGRNKLNNYFEGSVDDIGVWNRVLTQEEITGIYNKASDDLYTLIPDSNFENALINSGIDDVIDGRVLTSKISTLTALSVANSSIADLTGIQDFVSLNLLEVSKNNLTTLDLSKNTALTKLYCFENQLNTLDVSNNTKLTSLSCSSNNIKSLDFSKNLDLNYISCEKNQLNMLDVSQNTALTLLYCDENQLTSLDVSNNKALDYLVCSTNQLTSLDVSNNILLDDLVCSSNQLTTLDFSKNNILTRILCDNNNLSSLNIKNGNNTLLSNVNFTNNPNLTCIQVDDAIYSNANWTTKKDATANFNTDCATAHLYTYIPDVNFEKKLIEVGIDTTPADGKVLNSNINTLTSLNVSSANISSLKGIEGFTNLSNLECYENQLSSLDLSKNKALTFLGATGNQLTNLDISGCISLTQLFLGSNQLENLDLTKNIALARLEVNYNKLKTLDTSQNIFLTDLVCNSNQLTTLDTSQNAILIFFTCAFNSITSLDLSKNFELQILDSSNNQLINLYTPKSDKFISLTCENNKLSNLNIDNTIALDLLDFSGNQIKSIDVSKHKVLTQLFCAYNQLSSLDISKNNILNILVCSSNQLESLNLKNGNNTNFSYFSFIDNPNLTCIQVDDASYSNTNWANSKDTTASYSTSCTSSFVTIPDSNFEQKLIDLGIDTDGLNGKITIANINSITSLDLSNSTIKDLAGIENFTALKTLDCRNNQLTSLDFSKNTNLEILYVTGNPLVYINLKNGNNQNLIIDSVTSKKTTNTPGTTFLGITTLGCIKVDSATYSNVNWSKIKETTTTYSETCTLGLEDSEFNKAVLYPNPTKGEINILNITVEKATVYNTLGQLVKTFILDSSSSHNTINLSGLPKGVYYIYLINQDAASAKKVIVE